MISSFLQNCLQFEEYTTFVQQTECTNCFLFVTSLPFSSLRVKVKNIFFHPKWKRNWKTIQHNLKVILRRSMVVKLIILSFYFKVFVILCHEVSRRPSPAVKPWPTTVTSSTLHTRPSWRGPRPLWPQFLNRYPPLAHFTKIMITWFS